MWCIISTITMGAGGRQRGRLRQLKWRLIWIIWKQRFGTRTATSYLVTSSRAREDFKRAGTDCVMRTFKWSIIYKPESNFKEITFRWELLRELGIDYEVSEIEKNWPAKTYQRFLVWLMPKLPRHLDTIPDFRILRQWPRESHNCRG